MVAEKLLRKHVAIIHAHSLMSALQRKIFNVLLYEAISSQTQLSHKDSVAVECRIPLAKLSKSINFNSNNILYLKESIDELASLKIEWNILKDKVPADISFLNLRILHGSPTFYQDSTFNFSFHKIILDLSINPLIYGTVDLDLQSQFESKYGHSLYENSTRFVNLQKNKIIQLDVFKKLLGVNDNKYPNMGELMRNVIVPSVEEVNDRANFSIKLSNIKTGKKITGFEFLVESNQKSAKSSHQPYKPRNQKIYEEIKYNFGELSKSVVENIFQNYPEEYIFEKISYTKKFAKMETTGFYPIPYFISALKNDYRSSAQSTNSSEKVSNSLDGNSELKYEERVIRSEIMGWERLLEFHNDPLAIKSIQENIDQNKLKLQALYSKISALSHKAV